MTFNANHLVWARRIAQILSLFLLIVIIWNTRYPLSGFINPKFYFLIDPFAMYITSIAERVLLPGLLYSSILLILTFVLGRAFCGWICPLGAFLDFVSWARLAAFRIIRKKERELEPSPIRYIKYGILSAVFILAVPGVQLAWFFDPITIFVRTFSFNVHPAINGITDTGFIYLLKAADYPEGLESLYNALREGFLSLTVPKFPHTGVILAVLGVILFLSLVRRRFWCRYLCPLGATLALPAKSPLLQRDVHACDKNCGVCMNVCRMNAISGDNSYLAEECILCFDCVAQCPNEKSTFSFRKIRPAAAVARKKGAMMSRSRFITMAIAAILSVPGFAAVSPGKPKAPKRPPRSGTASLIRPPGSLPEKEFIQRCIRCGNCMKVCPTNVLQPSAIGAGIGGTWAPVMDTRRGYCEYQCNLCGQVCPTDAIRKLTLRRKQKLKIGIAQFDKKICIPYAKGEDCIVCEEHCPVPEKAIRVREALVKGKTVKQPYVVPDLCIGCAICELKCPTEPDKGVIVLKVRDA
jgi:polyferredoxin